MKEERGQQLRNALFTDCTVTSNDIIPFACIIIKRIIDASYIYVYIGMGIIGLQILN